MGTRKGVDSRDIAKRLIEGEAGNQIARDLGISRKAVHYHGLKYGVRSRHKARDPIHVEVDGETMCLHDVSRRYGIAFTTILYRYHQGDRGKRLVRVPMNNRPPDHYQLGLSGRDWDVAAAYARQIGVRAAAMRLRLPYGAISAAIRGEYDRLD